VRAGDEITRHYDPMIGKLIVKGEDRQAALRRLAGALDAWQVVGVATNIAFLQRVAAHDAYVRGDVDTGLIAAHRDALLPRAAAPSERMLAVAALGELERLRDAAAAHAAASADPWSPWSAIGSWWLNTDDHAIALEFAAGTAAFPVELRVGPDRVRVSAGERSFEAEARRDGDALRIRLDDETFPATIVPHGAERHVFCGGTTTKLTLVDRLAEPEEEAPVGGHLMAPMSGTVVAVLVQPGDRVERGAPLMILEAMKMEHTISAPGAGRVSAINYRAGEQVAEGADLIDIEAHEPPPG
jgi:3-methylcrotonyl-CoA carboxylase alpha subunit